MSIPIPGTLAILRAPIFPNSRQDKKITDDVSKQRKLGKNAGKWIKFKLPDQALEPIRKVASAARTWNYDITLPWEDGSRLCTPEILPRHTEEFGQHKAEFEQAVDSFMEQYPMWILHAKIMHRGTFNPDDYPKAEEMRKEFSLTMHHDPVPQVSHFVESVVGSRVNVLRQQLEQRNEQRIKAGIDDVWQRLVGPVAKMAEALVSPEQIFRDSLVDNVRDIVNLVPALNLTNNAALAAACKEIKDKLFTVIAEDLREKPLVRKATAQAAAALVAKFGAMGVRKFAS